MKPLASPFLAFTCKKPPVHHAATICIVLALLAASTEIAVVPLMIPEIGALAGVAAAKLLGFAGRIPPAAWLGVFAIAASLPALANRQSSFLFGIGKPWTFDTRSGIQMVGVRLAHNFRPPYLDIAG